MSHPEFDVMQVTTESDREELYRFRYNVFVTEQSKNLTAADHVRKILVDPLDQLANHFAVTRHGKIVASLRAIYGRERATVTMQENLDLTSFNRVEPDAFSFHGRLFVLPAYRGTAALSLLLRHCYRASRERGAKVDF